MNTGKKKVRKVNEKREKSGGKKGRKEKEKFTK